MSRMKYLWVFLFNISIACAQNMDMRDTPTLDFGEDNQQLEQKFKMASYLLIKSPLSGDEGNGIKSEFLDATNLYNSAQANFQVVIQKVNEKNWLEANAIIDSVLRDLTSSSRIISKKSVNKSLYVENMKRVESFVMPKWSDLSPEDQKTLGTTTSLIDELVDKSNAQALENNYEDANAFLYQAYNLKTQLLQKLNHESTIVYDLIFDTPQDEYLYMVKRNKHYQELIENVIAENKYDEQTLKLAKVYIDKGRNSLSQAFESEKIDLHKEAIEILEGSVKDLSTALKLLGIKF